jgi:phage protein U
MAAVRRRSLLGERGKGGKKTFELIFLSSNSDEMVSEQQLTKHLSRGNNGESSILSYAF